MTAIGGIIGFLACIGLLLYVAWEARSDDANTNRFIADLAARSQQQRAAQIERHRSVKYAPIPWESWDRALSIEGLEVHHEPSISQQCINIVDSSKE